ncbi:MAG: hypothetical protein BWY70_00846 [Bacteroidetes bacterium ADurb.Bin408]|nr:MAG: hypothetical protein BWY70_00846 [Bacteroidetes bacterium ADurb.Bin408]
MFFRFIIALQLSYFCLIGFSNAQNKATKEELQQYEDSLKLIAPEILNGVFDFNRYEASEKFMHLLTEVLSYENAFTYPFDSLKTISQLRAPDNYFRIFTWNLQKADGSYDFFGLIHLNPKKTKGETLFKLTNAAVKSSGSEYETLLPDSWYGAHYYKIIRTKGENTTYYTLLGWDGNNNITTRKVIDVIVFNANDEPEFGAPVFQTHENVKNRVIIEYAAHVSVSLKYEKHYVKQGKNKKWMIVFDRVSPLSPMLEGQYQFYVPETDTYDAFIFENNVWQFYQDVDARNPKIGKLEQKRKKSEHENRKRKPDEKQGF